MAVNHVKLGCINNAIMTVVYPAYMISVSPAGSGDVITHDDVMLWKHFAHNWTFVWKTHRSPMDSHHKRTLIGSFIFYFAVNQNKLLGI